MYKIQSKIESLQEGITSEQERESDRLSDLYKREEKSTSEWSLFLQTAESFMKSAPQTVLQFYIIAKNEEFVVSFNDIAKGILYL